ncbi:MAG: metallophosphoesterase, partial [Candidatus Aminicenantes bacterium]|nr:metallophosphoesterase [Candidatus Aminicenantes bacterium]
MRYLIFSDIHSNLEAFEKLLSLKITDSIDKFLFLGDLVGYGADPNDTISLFRSMKNTFSIRGNHDKVISNLESSSLFNPVAAFSAEWSKVKLSDENRKFLKELKKGPVIVDHFLT